MNFKPMTIILSLITILIFSALMAFLFFPKLCSIVLPAEYILNYHPSEIAAIKGSSENCPCCIFNVKRVFRSDSIIAVLRDPDPHCRNFAVEMIDMGRCKTDSKLLFELADGVISGRLNAKSSTARSFFVFPDKDFEPYSRRFLESTDPTVLQIGYDSMRILTFPDRIKYIVRALSGSNKDIAQVMTRKIINISDTDRKLIDPHVIALMQMTEDNVIMTNCYNYFAKDPACESLLSGILKDPKTGDKAFFYILDALLFPNMSARSATKCSFLFLSGSGLLEFIKGVSAERKQVTRKILSASYNHEETVMLSLLENKPEKVSALLPEHKDELTELFRELSPLDYALAFEDKESVQLLLKYGAKTAAELKQSPGTVFYLPKETRTSTGSRGMFGGFGG